MSSIRRRFGSSKKRTNIQSFFQQKNFLAESDSSIEKALFWTSNFLAAPTSGCSLLNLKSSHEKILNENISKVHIKINVGGQTFVIPYKTILYYPNTLLASTDMEQYFDKRRKEYFFDRDADMFRYVYNFYKNDKIHFPMDECMQALMDEFKFFRIPLEVVKDCCYAEFYAEIENNTTCKKVARQKREKKKSSTVSCKLSKRRRARPLRTKTRIRNFLSESATSTQAKLLSYGLLLCVCLNIIGFILETIPYSKSTKIGEQFPAAFLAFDLICVLILTTEFVVTVAVQKNKRLYFFSVGNFLFFISLVPGYITCILLLSMGRTAIPVQVGDALKALRIFRVVKIAKSSKHLRESVANIAAATRGLSLILVTCAIVILVLSVMIHHLDNSFPHVPFAMWYFVVTMTSLGYGDCVPSTAQGKVLGIIGVLLGVLVVSLPVPIIQNKLGASLDEVVPEPDEMMLDNFYPPDYADRQRRMSRMISLEHQVLHLKISTKNRQ